MDKHLENFRLAAEEAAAARYNYKQYQAGRRTARKTSYAEVYSALQRLDYMYEIYRRERK